jgi:hypothetical protein
MIRPRSLAGSLALVLLALAVAGCADDGAGTITIKDPEKLRATAAGAGAKVAAPAGKAAEVQRVIDEAVKKHPKLQ